MEIRIIFNESESETLQEIINDHKRYKPYNIDKLLMDSLREYMNTNFIPPSIELVGEDWEIMEVEDEEFNNRN